MEHLETELSELRELVLDMMSLASGQLEKARTAFLNKDLELAQEVIHNEKRMNAMELSIDRHCESILVLFQPVATDMRFVVSMLKINSDLERIGDYADGIADYVLDIENPIHDDALDATRTPEMFDITLSMLTDISKSLSEEDTALARKVYQKDAELNLINSNASRILTEFIKKDPEQTRSLLFLFSTIRKLERLGDHVKNIAEEIIFFIEAEILKHRKDD